VALTTSLGLVGYGVYHIPISVERKGFLGMGFEYYKAATFALAKSLRDISHANKLSILTRKGVIRGSVEQNEVLISSIRGTNSWIILTWMAFGLSVGVTGYGIFEMDISNERKGFLAMGLMFALHSTFHMAKNVRDRSEAGTWLRIIGIDSRGRASSADLDGRVEGQRIVGGEYGEDEESDM